MMAVNRDVASLPNLYAQLELEPGASEEEIRQAYRRLKAIYDHDSLVVYSLFQPEELDQIRQQLDDAYDTIIDPRTRREYDLSLFPERQPGMRSRERQSSSGGGASSSSGRSVTESAERSQSRPEMVSAELPPDLEITAATEFSGALLRRIREYKGLDLRDISTRTKISLMNLRFLEDERFSKLPAPVYVRGFLVEIAKYLRLPSRQVVDSYMERLLLAQEGQENKE